MTDAFNSRETLEERRLDAVADLLLTDQDSVRILPFHSGLPAGANAGNGKILSSGAFAPVYAIVCPDRYIPHGALLCSLLALGMPTADMTVGYVETTVQLSHTFFLSGGYHNLDAVFWEEDPRLPQFLSMVARLRNTNDAMLLSMSSSGFLDCEKLIALTERCLVPACVDPENLMRVYGTVKRIANEWKGAKIDLVILEKDRIGKAAGAAVVLEKMAQQFLSCSVHFIGSIPVDMDAAAPDGCLSGSFLRSLPKRVKIAAGEIAGNLIKSAGLR